MKVDVDLPLEWCDPPPRGNRHLNPDTPWALVVATLKANPCQWAQVTDPHTHSTGAVLCRKYPGLHYETRTVDGVRYLWLKWEPVQ